MQVPSLGGRSPGGGHGNPLWYSCLENPMDRGAWHPWNRRVGLGRSDLAQHRPGSSLLHAGFSLVAVSRGSSPVSVLGFLMWWLLMLQSTASGAHGLQQPWLPGLAAPGVWDLPGAGIKPVSPREALKYVLYESSRSLRLSILCSLVSPLMYFK